MGTACVEHIEADDMEEAVEHIREVWTYEDEEYDEDGDNDHTYLTCYENKAGERAANDSSWHIVEIIRLDEP